MGGLHRNHAVVTWRHVPAADAVLFVTDSVESVLSRQEVDFIVQLRNMGKYVLFAQTKCDAVDKSQVAQYSQRNLAILSAALSQLFDSIEYLLTSAHLARRSIEKPAFRARFWANSGLAGLETLVSVDLMHGHRRAGLLRVVAELDRTLAHVAHTVNHRASQTDAMARGDLGQAQDGLTQRTADLSTWLEND